MSSAQCVNSDSRVEGKAESIIDTSMSRLRTNQDQIEELVHTLVERLSSILSPEMPSEAANNSSGPPSAPVSAHVNALDLLGDRSNNTIKQLTSLITRIEL